MHADDGDWADPEPTEAEIRLMHLMVDPILLVIQERQAGTLPAPPPRRSIGKVERGFTVYFIQVGTDGPIKIGTTRHDVRRRLADLQASIPFDLRILAVIPGRGFRTERLLHERFSHLRLRGEWFRPHWGLLSFIEDEAVPWAVFLSGD